MSDNIKMSPPIMAAPLLPVVESKRPPGSVRKIVSILLSLLLVLFLVDAVVSLADDTVNLCAGFYPLMVIRLITSTFTLLLIVLVYLAMAFTPMIPKRVFLPLTWFGIVTLLAALPCMIYCY